MHFKGLFPLPCQMGWLHLCCQLGCAFDTEGCFDSMWVFIGCGEPRYLYAVMHCLPFCSIVQFITFESSFPFQLLKVGLVK